MAYTPRTIKDRVAVGDDIFIVEDLGNNRIRLIPAPTHVSEAGTPVNKALLQPIEDELGALSSKVDTLTTSKVDKVPGKGLSTNDFTNALKNKLDGIEAGAQVNTVTSVAGKTGAVTLTKSDVGLGSVQNYGIATQAQAQAGTANDVYMTPLRVKEATKVEFDAHKSSGDHDGRYYTKSQLLPIIHYLALDYWTSRASGTQESLISITYANGLWVTVGAGGTILTSTNGLTWTKRASNQWYILWDVTYANGLWVTVGESGRVRTSTDGTTWTTRDSGTNYTLYGVAYGNGLWVAVGADGRIFTSPDAISWTQRSSGTSVDLLGVAYGNGLWVAVGADGRIFTSPDGISWTSRSSGTSSRLAYVTYANGLWMAVGGSGTIRTSTNGTSWTSRTSGTTKFLNKVVYVDGLWVVAGNDEAILVSTDGAAWALRLPNGTRGNLLSVAYGNGLWITTGNDGRIWTARTITL